MSKIVLTTADPDLARDLRAAFEPDDQISFVGSPDEAVEALAGEGGDAALILTGVVDEAGAERFITTAARHAPGVPVIALLERDGEVSEGPAVRLGFDDFAIKPVDPIEVALRARRSIARKQLQDELGILGKTQAIHDVLDRVQLIAPVGSTVLITGESGVGKELVARGLHRFSPRRGKAFIAVNIAALPETLLESELFGHEKGAFTGAASLRKGMFELANGGTIFLDEVAEMPLGVQTKLLRVLEQREFMRVGGSTPIKVDVRVITATNRDLRRAVELGEFRRDLYHRINVLQINIPLLRDRREDIPLLVHEFIRTFSAEHDREFKGITPEAMDILVNYDWPGNVRELRNLVESMVVLAPGSVIRPDDIPPDVRRGAGRIRAPQPIGSMLPAPPTGGPPPAPSREMEFIFRTLVELKLDMEDVKDQFENYKRKHPELVTAGVRQPPVAVDLAPRREGREVELTDVTTADAETTDAEGLDEDGVVIFRPGMTMEELERAAIITTLEAENGNRRRASEKLGIGERTLYRKLKEYEIGD